jgi:hypothetical protein
MFFNSPGRLGAMRARVNFPSPSRAFVKRPQGVSGCRLRLVAMTAPRRQLNHSERAPQGRNPNPTLAPIAAAKGAKSHCAYDNASKLLTISNFKANIFPATA